MEDITIFLKAILTSFLAAISMRLGALNGLLGTFFAAIILDYLTGIIAAAYHKELSSRIGLRGIMKKLGSCVAVAVALLADDVASASSIQLGTGFSTQGAIACIVTIWLILNELISMLENLAKMRVPLPAFLLAAVKLLKLHTEQQVKQPENEEKSNKN